MLETARPKFLHISSETYIKLSKAIINAFDEAWLKSIAKKRALKDSFLHRNRSMLSVLKSFGKYQDSIEKMCSRNECPLQAKLCNKRWRVVSLLMSVWLLLLLRRPSHSSYLISTYNACKQHILIFSVSILPNWRKNITMVVKLRFQAFSVNATHLRIKNTQIFVENGLHSFFFFSSRSAYAMEENGLYFVRFAFSIFLRNFWGRHPENRLDRKSNPPKLRVTLCFLKVRTFDETT